GWVFVANSGDHSVSMLDAGTGATVATIALGRVPAALTVDETHGRVFTLNSCDLSGANSPQWCLGRTSTLSVLDLRRGTLLGTVDLGAVATVLAVDQHAGRVVVAHAADAAVSLCDTTGHLLRTITLPGTPQEIAVDSRLGRVFLGVNDAVAHRGRVSM